MQQKSGLVTSLSVYTLDNTTAIASVAFGACVIEKHVTLDRTGGGPDDSFSLEPIELENLCRDSKTAWESLGKVDYGRKSSEQANVKFRRSLYFVKDIKSGEIITQEHIRRIRPGFGLPPRFESQIIDKKAKVDVCRGSAANWNLIDD